MCVSRKTNKFIVHVRDQKLTWSINYEKDRRIREKKKHEKIKIIIKYWL